MRSLGIFSYNIEITRTIIATGLVITVIIWALSGFPFPEIINNFWGFCCTALFIIVVLAMLLPSDKKLLNFVFRK